MNTLFRSLVLSAAILCMSSASADQLWQLICSDCRDSTTHPRDFGNFALNQTYGPDSWILEDQVIVHNLHGDWVHVDLSFEVEGNILTYLAEFIGLDLSVPTGNIIVETMTDHTADDEYAISMDMIDTMGPLNVGEQDDDPPSSGGGDSAGGGGGGVGTGGGSGGGGGGNACTSAGEEWHCVPY